MKTTPTSTRFSLNAGQLLKLAYKMIGVVSRNGEPTLDQSNMAIKVMNQILKGWQQDGSNLHRLEEMILPVSAYQGNLANPAQPDVIVMELAEARWVPNTDGIYESGVVTFMTNGAIINAIVANGTVGADFFSDGFQPTIGSYDLDGISAYDSATDGPDAEGKAIFTYTLSGNVPLGLMIGQTNAFSYGNINSEANAVGLSYNGSAYANMPNSQGYLTGTNGGDLLYNGQAAGFQGNATTEGTYSFNLIATSIFGSVGTLPITLTINEGSNG